MTDTNHRGWVLTKVNNSFWMVTHPGGAVTKHKTEDSALKAMTWTIAI